MIEPFLDYLRSKLSFTDEQISGIEPHLQVRHLEKGEVILSTGEINRHINFVLKGCLRSYVIDSKGKEHIIQFAPENWWISEQISFFKKEPAIYSIDAIEKTDMVVLDSSFFEQLNGMGFNLREVSGDLIMNSLRSFQKRLISHLSETGDQRYLGFIKTYPSLAMRLPLWMIASYLGLAPESLSRIRKDLYNVKK